MKIIQSFSYIKRNATYDIDYDKYAYINGYYMLYSYLTLKKYYNSVTMYCDQAAYDKILKYIPYDEVIIFENEHINDPEYWNAYKTSVINQQQEAFIHVDTDVFIFDRIFDEFINGDHDIICQDVLQNEQNPLSNNYPDNEFIYRCNNLIGTKYIDGFASGGVIGLRNREIIDNYSKITKTLLELVKSDSIILDDPSKKGIIVEEYGLYLLYQYYNYKLFTVLDFDLVQKHGSLYAGQYSKYTHMWFKSRLVKENFNLVRGRILTDHPEQKATIEEFDRLTEGFDFNRAFSDNVDRYFRKNW